VTNRKMTIQQKLDIYKKQNIKRVKLGITDMDGVIRGKYLSLEKFSGLAHDSAGFCDCIFGWDVNDQLYDNASFTGWHTAFPDAPYHIDLASERRLIEENNIPYFIAELSAPDNQTTHPICPRNVLKAILAKGEALGYGFQLAFEYEFFIFNETPHSAKEKHYQQLTPLSPGNFGYSILRTTTHSALFNAFMDYHLSLDCELEGLHCETGPGVWEAAIKYDTALNACDKATLFKTFSKAFFQKRNMLATFMAKWSMNYPGQSGHCHQSMIDLSTGRNLFYDDNHKNQMSDLMRHYVAGVQIYLRPFLALYAPTINSYTRLVKGAWAPTAASWGIDNRTTALRVIPGTEKSQRLEFRLSAADANPYLVAAACVGSGLLGIQKKLKLTEAIPGNAYEHQHELSESLQLFSNLRDANFALTQSDDAPEVFGKPFVEHFTASRDWEIREYERHINDWQLQRYLEII